MNGDGLAFESNSRAKSRRLLATTTLGLAAASVLALGPWAGSAAAQATLDAGSPARPADLQDSDATTARERDTVIVTARQRSEEIQEVPLSITTFSEASLKAQGIEEPSDLRAANFVFPETYTSTRSYVSSRGIFQEAPIIGFDGGFSQYLDGVYMGRNMAYATDLGEVERVEILRGPQGMLFGRNAIGGVMNIITKKPGREFGGDLSAEFGSWDLRRVRGHINAPLVGDQLLSRLSFQRTSRDGYVDNVNLPGSKSGDIDLTSARGQLLFVPMSKLQVNLSIDHSNSRNSSYQSEVVASESTFPAGGDDRKYSYNGVIQPVDLKRDTGLALTADYSFDSGHTLTSITGVRETTTRWVFSDDATPRGFQKQDLRDQQEIWSQEVRLASPSATFFDYVIGAYYYNEKAALYGNVAQPVLPPHTSSTLFNVRSVTEDWAAFASANFRVTDKLTLRSGVRYTHEVRDASGRVSSGPVGDAFIPPLVSPTFTRQLEAEEVNWELGADYRFTPEMMGYVRAATGFKGGGFNATDGRLVQPEHLISYEAGVKSEWLDSRLVVNGAVFVSDYEDLQVRSRQLGSAALVILQNAADVRAAGAELEVRAYPTDQLSLNFSLGYVDSTFKEFRDTRTFEGVFFDATGNQLPMTPNWTISGSIQFDQPLRSGAELFYRADIAFIDERYGVLDAGQNNHRYLLPSNTTLNARFGYRSSDERWRLEFWGRNLTDEDAAIDRNPHRRVIPGSPNAVDVLQKATYMPPRSFGVLIGVAY